MKNRIAAAVLVVGGLASAAFAGAPEADAFVPGADVGYMLATYVSDDPIIHNAGAGAGGAAGGTLGGAAGGWLGFKIGAKLGAAVGGPLGAIVGAGVGAG
ncbi:MAG: hypothetical protein F4Y86_15405 [Gammaproteobacteria bacterium]|nr:hypothetical protein [Gammaproteobacteria bacterium]MYB38909.1 hypothetical protein [Gammaproteobacteria bacterium]